MNKFYFGGLALIAGATIIMSNPAKAVTSCIITVSGNKYDVTTLKNSHTGGDVFVCGTDQTALYQGQHGSSLDRIKPFLVSSPKPTVTADATTQLRTPGAVTQVKNDKYEDDDDAEYQKSKKTTQEINKKKLATQYELDKKKLEIKHRQQKKDLEKKQAGEKKALEAKYKAALAKIGK